MACFWNACHAKVPAVAQARILDGKAFSPKSFADGIQRMVRDGSGHCTTDHSRWQGQPLQKQLRDELRAWLLEYDTTTVNQGKLTSICDPFFLFLSTTFNLTIQHNFMGHTIIYSTDDQRPSSTIQFRSNSGHID